MKTIIHKIFDLDTFLEVHRDFAQNAIVGFARLHGQVVGVVAQQPTVLAGVIDIDTSDKMAGFIRFCDAFNIPLITFIDSPGFMPGVEQEHGGIIRHGAKIVYAYSEATVLLADARHGSQHSRPAWQCDGRRHNFGPAGHRYLTFAGL